METAANLKPLPAAKVARELWIWLKYSLFIVGAAASVTFARVNFFGADIVLRTETIPLLVVPNARIVDPTPMPRK